MEASYGSERERRSRCGGVCVVAGITPWAFTFPAGPIRWWIPAMSATTWLSRRSPSFATDAPRASIGAASIALTADNPSTGPARATTEETKRSIMTTHWESHYSFSIITFPRRPGQRFLRDSCFALELRSPRWGCPRHAGPEPWVTIVRLPTAEAILIATPGRPTARSRPARW